MTNEQKIQHVLINIVHMTTAMYYVYFGKQVADVWKENPNEESLLALQNHAKHHMLEKLSIPEMDDLYIEISSNNELKDNLPE